MRSFPVPSSRRLNVEQLEDRCVPSATTFGSPWPDATHLTLSFAPDGTSVLGHSSVLFQTLNTIAPTATWEAAKSCAPSRPGRCNPTSTSPWFPMMASRWAHLAPEGDPRFGDIRIAGFAMPSGELAVTSPFDYTAGTWSGDAKLNTATPFSIGGGNGTVDSYTAMLHEAAHSFGLPDNNDPNSAVVLNYAGPRTGLDANDVANIQSLYGVRNPDPNHNNTFATATPLTLLANSNTSLGIQANGSINSLSDVDFYRFQAPPGAVSTTLHLHTAGVSLLDVARDGVRLVVPGDRFGGGDRPAPQRADAQSVGAIGGHLLRQGAVRHQRRFRRRQLHAGDRLADPGQFTDGAAVGTDPHRC